MKLSLMWNEDIMMISSRDTAGSLSGVADQTSNY